MAEQKQKASSPEELGDLAKSIQLFLDRVHQYDGTEVRAGQIQVFVPDGMGSDRLFQDEEEMKFAMDNPEIDRIFQSIKNDSRVIK